MAKTKVENRSHKNQVAQPSGTSRKKILVVGDWVIDEHWVTSIHRSKTRSRAGINHYRSIQEPDGCVLTLAGAGKTTSILYEAVLDSDGSPKPYELIGLGAWHPDDESTLAHLLTPAKAVGQTHHRLTYPLAATPPDVRLFNLGTAIKNDGQCMTTRVIRIYQQTGSEYVLLDRIDWELPHVENRKLNFSVLDKELAPHLKEVEAILIKDMAKGVVDESLILWLRKKFGQEDESHNLQRVPAWFISSKNWMPQWIDKLPGDAVSLYIVPQVAAHAAFEDPGFSRWITGDESVTKEALDRIDQLARRFHNALICVLPFGLSVLARANSGTEAVLFKQPVVGAGLHAEGMPMASVFLPVLVSLLLEQGVQDQEGSPKWSRSKETCQMILSSALSFTEAWMREEMRRITESKVWKDNSQKLIVSSRGLRKPEFDVEYPLLPRWTHTAWEESTREWEQAYEGRGVILRRTEEEYGVLEIKRATVEVDGYVCCVETKREVLRQLTAEIQSFNPADGNSKSFMLKASPGAGKSYLINKLADLHHLQLLQFNITSLLTRNDLLDCFDTIVTTQARARHKKYIVFFDEIDSNLEGHPVYDAFLRPLEEGLYMRAGKAFYIGPCIWVFAGTRDPASNEDGPHGAKAKKGSDFVSRLSAAPFPFDYAWSPKDEFRNDGLERLENVYAGAALLKRAFQDITHVSEAVLEVFRVIPPKVGVRKIDRFVRRFDQIQYGKVTTKNLPSDWREYMEVSPKGVRTWDDNLYLLRERLIKIA